MNKFIEENYKWLVRIFTLLGFFFIVKLFLFGVYFHFHVFNGFLEYWWTNAGYISVTFFIISLFIIYFIKIIKNKVQKVFLSFLILFMGLFGKSFFYILSPDFEFYLSDIKYEYIDKDGNLKDMDKYLYYMGKYCNNNIDDFKFKRVYREDMCAGKYLYDFKTVEEYSIVFDFANKKNLKELYRLTYIGAEDFGLEKIIQNYNDDTFYGYVLDRDWTEDLFVEIIYENTNNIDIKKIILYIKEGLILLQNNKFDDFFEERKEYDNFNFYINEKLEEIESINTKIF